MKKFTVQIQFKSGRNETVLRVVRSVERNTLGCTEYYTEDGSSLTIANDSVEFVRITKTHD